MHAVPSSAIPLNLFVPMGCATHLWLGLADFFERCGSLYRITFFVRVLFIILDSEAAFLSALGYGPSRHTKEVRLRTEHVIEAKL